MEFLVFLIGTGVVGLLFFLSVLWYDWKHKFDW